MAAQVKGAQIIWGVQDDTRDAALVASTAGIVTSFSMSHGGTSTTQTDEQDNVVTRFDHGGQVKVTMEVACLSTTTLPAKGDEIDLSDFIIDGVDFASTALLVDDAKVDYANATVKKITISATFYPEL